MAVAVLLWGEVENWRSSCRLVGGAVGTSEAVVVLGFRNRGSRANAVNRWRVRAGLRSQDPAATVRRLVLCGGGPPGDPTEAAVMAAYARESCGYRGEVVIEDRSRTTWENIANSLPHLEEADRIKIVSNPFHAEKGRLYLTRLRPDLAERLVRGDDYHFGEWMPLKPLAAVYGRWVLRRNRPAQQA
jgi:uncharacterized SAM-binding protein YcdF (DUF218 family)